MRKDLKIWVLILALAPAVIGSGGCASSTAGKAAGEGAVLGTVGGAVAGGVSALLFGGNVASGMATGAAIGAASGAATGAVSGAMADSKAKDQQAQQQAKQQKAEELRKKIGDQNFEAADLLAHCKHRQAIGAGQKAYSSTQDPEQRLYALYIQAVAAEESGDKETASSAYAQAVKDDPSKGPVEKVKVQCLEGVMKVQKIRQDYGLPPTCK
jgi:hypothetical protein